MTSLPQCGLHLFYKSRNCDPYITLKQSNKWSRGFTSTACIIALRTSPHPQILYFHIFYISCRTMKQKLQNYCHWKGAVASLLSQASFCCFSPLCIAIVFHLSLFLAVDGCISGRSSVPHCGTESYHLSNAVRVLVKLMIHVQDLFNLMWSLLFFILFFKHDINLAVIVAALD